MNWYMCIVNSISDVPTTFNTFYMNTKFDKQGIWYIEVCSFNIYYYETLIIQNIVQYVHWTQQL